MARMYPLLGYQAPVHLAQTHQSFWDNSLGMHLLRELGLMPYKNRKNGERLRAQGRAAAGLCRNCPAKAIPSESRCQTCKERRRKR